MSYITRQKVDEITTGIRNEMNQISNKILETEEKLTSISDMANEVQSKYQGKVVANSLSVDRSNLDEEGHGTISATYELFDIKGASEITSSCIVMASELEELKNPLDALTHNTDSIEEAMEIIAVYINKVEEELFPGDSNRSYLQKMKIAIDYYMKKDFENNFDILYDTPILEEGKLEFWIKYYDKEGRKHRKKVKADNCKYYKFFNKDGINFIVPVGRIDENGRFQEYKDGIYQLSMVDGPVDVDFSIFALPDYIKSYKKIAKHSEKYSAKFNEYATKNLEQVTFIDNYGNGNILAHVTPEDKEIMIYRDAAFTHEEPIEDSYTHEMGHMFDYYYNQSKPSSSSSFYFSEDPNGRWQQIQEELNNIDTSSEQPIRSYAQEDNAEGFAEMVAEYYGSYAESGGLFDSNDLKTITVGERTLYDIMKEILEQEDAV